MAFINNEFHLRKLQELAKKVGVIKMIINRDKYLNQIIERKESGLIKIITSLRRCGKSYLLNNLYIKDI